jgi:predicted nucleotidyltransferase
MSSGHVNPELATRLPLERIGEICQRYGISELSVYGLNLEGDVHHYAEELFLVEFLNNDFGPWGCKLDQVENDLSGALHRKVHVASREGVRQSTPSPRREEILTMRQMIYELEKCGGHS